MLYSEKVEDWEEVNRSQASVQKVKNFQATAILGRKESGLEFDPGSIA